MGRKERTGSDSREGDIVKKGFVYIKRPPTSSNVKIRIKAWQKRYFVLRDASFENGPTTLDIYPNEHAWASKSRDPADLYIVDLRKVTLVEEYNESKNFPNAFTVSRKGQSPLVMGAESLLEMKEWLVAIKMLAGKLRQLTTLQVPDAEDRRPSCPPRLGEGETGGPRSHWRGVPGTAPRTGSGSSSPEGSPQQQLLTLRLPHPDVLPKKEKYLGYLVTVQATEATDRNMLAGDYKMAVLESDVALRRPGSTENVLVWPIANIRKFKSEDWSEGNMDLVTLEGNVHCGLAEGMYCFKTRYGKELIQLVRQAARVMSKKTAAAAAAASDSSLPAVPHTAAKQLPTFSLTGAAARQEHRIQRIGSAPCLDVSPSLIGCAPADLPDCLLGGAPRTHLVSGDIKEQRDSEISTSDSGEDEAEAEASAAGYNSYLKLIGDQPIPAAIPSSIREEPPVIPTRRKSTPTNLCSTRRPLPNPLSPNHLSNPVSPNPVSPKPSEFSFSPKHLTAGGGEDSPVFTYRPVINSDNSTQFQLDDIVPLSSSPGKSRIDSGFSDNDVFDVIADVISPTHKPCSPLVVDLDQDIPLSRAAMEDNSSIAEEVLVSTTHGVEPVIAGAPPKPPPRPTYTLSQNPQSH